MAFPFAVLAATNRSWITSFAALGCALGGLQAEARSRACWRFEDGQQLHFRAVLESLPMTEKAMVRMLAPCAVTVSARLPRGQTPPPGREFSGQARWMSVAIATDALPRPGGGVLMIQSIDSVTDRVHHVLLWRAQMQARIRALFPNYAGLTEALLVAQRDGLDAEIKARYAAAGLTHLLAISGTHVALVAAVLWLFARMARTSRRSADIVCCMGTTAYVFFLGAPFAALRALLQLYLVMIARNLQRPAHPLGLVAAAALVIVACYPHAVLDAGFQLSFAGIAAIVIWRRPLIDAMPSSVPTVLRDALATTVSATLVTTPIAAFHFGTVSTIALLANLLAIPAVTIAVPASAAAVAVSALSMPLGHFLAAGAEVSLASLDRVAIVSEGIPYGHFAAHPRQLMNLLPGAPGRRLEIHLIDVGQGDAIAVRTPAGKWILVDAGPASPTYDAGERRVLPFLLARGAPAIELLIITHPHLDHFGGAAAVIRGMRVRNVLDPGVAVRTPEYDSLLITAHRRGTHWLRARAGMSLTVDGVRLDFLHPDTVAPDMSEDAVNDHSAVFLLVYGQFSALFLGDVSEQVETMLSRRQRGDVDIDLLKVAHHGSRFSTGEELLVSGTPQVALVPVGRRNRYRHPSPEVIDRLEAAGAVIFRTDRDGTVSLQVNQHGAMAARRRQ